MSGKALSSAREGERVGVFVPESRMNFTGIVMGNKAVSVEIN
jgi:flagella basal body P-ring formation protein FlgA